MTLKQKGMRSGVQAGAPACVAVRRRDCTDPDRVTLKLSVATDDLPLCSNRTEQHYSLPARRLTAHQCLLHGPSTDTVNGQLDFM